MVGPWGNEGSWLKCALHAHTTESDGEMPPASLVAHYGRLGFDVLALTDHWAIAGAPSTQQVLVLSGVELNCVMPGARDGHVLGLGLSATPDELRALAGDYSSLEQSAAWIVAHGGLAFLAHPYWTGITPGTLELPANVHGIEIFNAGCELELARGLAAVHWDELLEAGRMCTALATDDSHHPGFDSGHAWTWVRAAERTSEAVLAAIAAGSFYGSAGPRLDSLVLEGATVHVSCSPSRAVTLVSSKSIGAAVNAGRHGYLNGGRIEAANDAGLIVAASLEVPPGASYARIEVTDATGMKAWSNPFRV
ncbi:MAG: CehA/McbA family metallohydrolase [Gaiellales bacterium]